MPEEINRILADHCSDYLFAPTEKARQILLHEGISDANIEVTGNTVVDAVFQNLEFAEKHSLVLANLGLNRGSYFLATVHRQENVDDEMRLRGIIDGLKMVHKEYGQSIIYPVHPRTRKALEDFGLKTEGLNLVGPQDYLSFLQLESNARLVLTDSGGVQEETCVLNVPCVALRDNTERPETIDVGSNSLAGTNPEAILENVKLMLGRSNDWKNPFGDGNAASRIVEVLRRKLE
jgi:UDP-N-acetylglucosamine 2-epimerase (non-hydrolysing)